MTETIRSERPSSPADAQERDRDARVEHLLLTGLDHYFAGQHELAISVWTRVLFLNHGHARARAYMERARSAIAERQREGEELLHTGVEAFARGDAVAARRLLTSAIERGAASEQALALLDRLNRLEPRSQLARVPRAHLDLSSGSPDPIVTGTADRRPSPVPWVTAGAAVGVTVAVAAIWLWSRGADPWLARRSPSAHAPVASAEPLPIPAVSEASITRARMLQAKGRLHESLGALDGVHRGDASWTEAEALRAAIQRQLRAGFGSPLADAIDGYRTQVVPR